MINETICTKHKEEKFDFLFVDMEWNQKAGTSDISDREPIQIGLIGTNENLEIIKLFSKNICLENINTLTDETCKLVHTNTKAVMQAKTEIEVFKRVNQSFPKYKYVVVWTLSTYELFECSMNKAGIKMPRHKVLVLQDILSTVALSKGQNIGFETALLRAEIPYEKAYLHCSKHDVKYLCELFKQMYKEYQELTQGEFSVVNARSKIIHSPRCRYLKSSSLQIEVNKKSLLFKGYRPCTCCGNKAVWRRIYWKPMSKQKRYNSGKKGLRELPLTDENIQLICNQFGIKCNIGENIIFLTTNCGQWRVYLNGEDVEKLFHGNYRISQQEFKKRKKYNEGFHEQNISMHNFYDVVRYIYYHDKYSYKNKKKDRLELLFEQIERERLMKESY